METSPQPSGQSSANQPTIAQPITTDPVCDQPTIAHVGAATTAAAALSVQMRFGEFELIEEIARGGMGVVYRARQVELDRIVALKMILTGQLASEEEVGRFRVEALAAAQLEHANIVSIYDVGEVDGQHYFSMEYVKGANLSKLLGVGVLPGRKAAEYIEQVARAVHYAHERGILHRDLKPGNILVNEQNQPKITDFGLAKLMPATGGPPSARRASDLTRTGRVMGTPGYMSPEQASGQSRELGPACDVYGIGAVLYELLTGRPPFRGESDLETVLQVLNQDPVPPRLLHPNVDVDLETICLKCLEKDPALRYPSAAALADDLHRYLHGEAITARSINLLERLTRTLAHSQHDKHFRHWGLGLMVFALIIFVAHASTTTLLEWDVLPEAYCYMVPRFVEFLLIGIVLWYSRPRSLLPTNAAERLIWAVWIGYLIAFATLSWGLRELGLSRVEVYPASAILSGLAFFIMGCHVWGGCYVIGVAFMIAGSLMTLHIKYSPGTELSPLIFGTMWGLALLVVGVRYWRMGKAIGDQ